MTKIKDAPKPDEVVKATATSAPDVTPNVTEEAPPSYAKIGVTPMAVCDRLRIIDAETGDLIEKVIEADADKGLVVRYLVEDGALVRDDNRFKTIEETRAIRIEWRTGKQKDSF
ncbi:hypothetical protein EBBID32_45340 [Sphingobium indicum BiD32]|uniref:Uncharacterized protein n=1 Tax=Sphingobium indicum BiD32 TaxID=1301087 RepID=N1MY39_9SPHN|nr:hypothetical protein [Sphingobium indicum]CCW20163.1 hypothetical protein EBBID32_45340 [Sphingobium indicum BiD32]